MKKLVFGLVLGLTLSLGINVNAAEISGQLVKIVDSDKGGNVQTFNKDSVINAKLGAEQGDTDTIGGTLYLYNGGEKNKRIAIGTSKINDYGTMNFYDKFNNARIGIKADDKSYGPLFLIADSKGNAITYLSSNDGCINNQRIITEDYLKKYISKDEVQKMIDEAVSKALNK